ncbi:hypothetical protein H4R19_000416 [Coemansia spiralis]|nr:hypothetical protein H4R19_000416 [Coemansia spiralis]
MGNGLSFSVTPAEQLRADLVSASEGIHVDPRGRGDAIMIVFFATLYSLDAVAVAYMLYNRNYPPIRCKSPILMAAVMAFSVLWLLGDIQSNGHVPLLGTSLQNCKVYGIWISVVLGVCTVSALLAIRTLGLMRVFLMGQPFRGRGLYLPLLLYAVAMIVFGAVVQALPGRLTMYYLDVVDVCYITDGLQAAVFAVVWLIWMGVIVLSWRARTIKSSFNEGREAAIACVIVFSVLTSVTVMHYALPTYPLNATYRILTTSIDHVSTSLFWWIVMGVPLFNCMFRRERYLNEWTLKLLDDGLEVEYDVQPIDDLPIITIMEQQTATLAPSALPAVPHLYYSDANHVADYLKTPITDVNNDRQGVPTSWLRIADHRRKNQLQASKPHIPRW